ncbi:MAG TPA: hypothetical protein VMW27_08485 [Thermoanaerobaculia bacterium]|nr:hypothetical protein [Thermoanaerobaculia bacterium]
MAVASKNRRKLTVNDRRFLWYVAEDDEGAGMVLQVLSSDKQFITKYQLDQPEGDEYLVVLGRLFAGASTGGSWRRFRCPRFAGESVTPRDVRNLIDWCLDESLTRQEIDWRSHPIRL